MKRIFSACLPVLLLAALPLAAQEADTAPAPAVPEARPEDVSSIGAILTAAYDVISGPKGEARDWDRFRSLFLPEARFIPTGLSPEGTPRYRVLGVEEFVEQIGPGFAEQGFFEREAGRVSERFGNVAHAMSAYESRRAAADPEPFQRGVNSFQLYHDGDRWWIVTILWDSERPGLAIPERYLRAPGAEAGMEGGPAGRGPGL